MFDLNNIPFDVYGVLGAILTAVATYVGAAVARFIKDKQLGGIVEAAVRYAEQKIGSGNGEQKYHLAANIVAEEAAKAHIKIDGTKLANAIEPAVLKLNAELAQSYADVPATEEKADTGDATSADQASDQQQEQAPNKAVEQPTQSDNTAKPATAAQPAQSAATQKVGDMTLDELKKALK